jgi:pimeloyl-ACP methyl ester carboxylesterase
MRMTRVLKWLALGTLALLALAVLVVTGSAQLSLDRQRQHRAATQSLSVFSGFAEAVQVRIPARGMEFRARIAGSEGSGVILLHGLPTTSAMFEPLIEAAAASGHRVVAFDQRGYSPGARPESVADYVIGELIADVLAIADAVGFERFHLVGHDWGSAVGWNLVLRHPERVLTWTALSVPHPAAFLGALQSDPDQRRRSRYTILLTLPWVPETLMTFNRLAELESLYVAMRPAERAEYLRVFAEPGALTAALNWYRASWLYRNLPSGELPTEVSLPSLFIWGNQDPYLGRRAVEAQSAFMKGPFREVELEADHWLMEQSSARVVPEILVHWARYGSDPKAAAPVSAVPSALRVPFAQRLPVAARR